VFTIYGNFGSDKPKKEFFKLAKQTGFTGATLWWSDKYGDSNFRENPRQARNAGLHVDNVHAPYDGINDIWLDNQDGEALTNNYFKIVEDCANYQIPTMVFHVSTGNAPPPFNEIGLNRIKRLVEKAEKHDVNIAFENLKKVAYLEYVLNNINSPRAGFCYDTGHHNCYCPQLDLLAQYGSRLMALHLHDNDGTADQHLLPLEGTIDWAVTMHKLAKTGYMGPLTFELRNKEGLPFVAFFNQVYECGKKLEVLRV